MRGAPEREPERTALEPGLAAPQQRVRILDLHGALDDALETADELYRMPALAPARFYPSVLDDPRNRRQKTRRKKAPGRSRRRIRRGVPGVHRDLRARRGLRNFRG